MKLGGGKWYEKAIILFIRIASSPFPFCLQQQ
jgi:hypothetical protein